MDHEDKVHKIRPILQMLRDALNRIPKEECLCVDEQIVPFKGRSSLKQYNAKKPHKWGYKIWALCGKSGFAYDIELYTGKENNVIQGEVDCGASSNVVVRLSRTIEPVGHTLYFDNYFTSVDLLVFLEKRGIHSVGTVRSNRLTNLSPMSEKELKKSGRGSMNEYTTHVDGVDIYYVQWFDNKVVNLLSTFAGMEPINKVNRWFSSLKQRREIDCPDVVRIYNKHMGGVDLLDSLLGLHRTNVRSKKWYHRIFFHCMDMVVVNSWLLYRRVHVQNQLNVASLSLADFKADLAESLCKFRKGSAKKRRKKVDQAWKPSWMLLQRKHVGKTLFLPRMFELMKLVIGQHGQMNDSVAECLHVMDNHVSNAKSVKQVYVSQKIVIASRHFIRNNFKVAGI